MISAISQPARFTTSLIALVALLVLSPNALALSVTEFHIPTGGSNPQGITAGPDGALWFTEKTGNKIGRITTAGTFTNEFVIPTVASEPAGITTGPDGNLWFAESQASRIGRITPGGVITEFTLPASRVPDSIVTGPDGNLYFTEQNGDRIGRLNPAAGLNAAIQASIVEFAVPGVGSSPSGIAVGPDANLWFTEFGSDEIGRLTTAGVVTSEFAVPGAGSGPTKIALGPDGALWFTEVSGELGRITTAGTISEVPIPAAGSQPDGIAARSDGTLWFAEGGVSSIGRAILGGPAVSFTEFPTPTSSSVPAGIARGPDDSIWFTEANGNVVGRVTEDVTEDVPPPQPPDKTAPVGSALTFKPRSFAAERKGASIGRKRAKRSSTVSYRLSEAAKVSFLVESVTKGRKVGRKCRKKSHKNRKRNRCTLIRTLRGSFAHKGQAGTNSFRFTGRIAGRALKYGNYRLVASPRDLADNRGEAFRSSFAIVKR